MKAEDVKRLKELECENRELKQIVADNELDIRAYKEIARGTPRPGSEAPSRLHASAAARPLRASGVPDRRPAPIDAALPVTLAPDGAAVRGRLRQISEEKPR